MKVFIGWSGNTSEKIASILKSWLPLLNEHIEPGVSVDMERGAAWRDSLSQMISSCDGALFCVTEENVNSTWLHYEAGAVSGQDKFVIPVLFDTSARVLGPLGQFQSLTLRKDDMRRLAYDLNNRCEKYAVSPEVLDTRFEVFYPTIESMLEEVRNSRERDVERAQEYYKQALALRQQTTGSQMARESLKRDFETLNSKLDAILSQISKVSSGNIGGKAE